MMADKVMYYANVNGDGSQEKRRGLGRGRDYREHYTGVFNEYLEKFPKFKKYLEIAENNSPPGSNIWIAGGFLYRAIIEGVYGVELKEKFERDIDFVTERPRKGKIITPPFWEAGRTNWGSLSFTKGDVRVDLSHLSTDYPTFRERGWSPTIGNMMKSAPLNIQALAYDCDRKEIVRSKKAWVGVNAIKNCLIKVNDYDEAESVAESRGTTVEELVRIKAEELDFRASYSGIPDLDEEYRD